MTSDPTDNVTATYDPENRIQSTAGVTYTYDADGNRVEKSGGTASTLYWYMTPGIIAESDLSGTLKSEYVFFNGKRLARIDLLGSTVHCYLSDHLNSTSMVISGAGAVEDESDYSPFGTEYVLASSGLNHYKFTSKERDSESGLDYFGARYYSSPLGRFITPDWAAKAMAVPYAEFADPQSLNLYSYVRNVPTTRFDVDGHFQSSLIDKVSPLPPPPLPPPAPSVPKDVASVNLPGPQYKTVDQAAKSVIRNTNHQSVTENKEIAGRVVKNSNGTYGTTKGPESGRAEASAEPGDVPKGTVNAGIWHDHGAATPGADNEHFSDSRTDPLHLPGDKDLARSEHVPIYVGTPGGTIRKYDPATGQDRKIGNTPN
jgi:RHS repeat-associated protein